MRDREDLCSKSKSRALAATNSCRFVPAFSIQALRTNAVTSRPEPVPVRQPRPVTSTIFRRSYQRGQLPAVLTPTSSGHKISWKTPLNTIDYRLYFPIFCEGLAENTHPYHLLARYGTRQMIDTFSVKLSPTIPLVIMPLKRGLSTCVPSVMAAVLHVLQQLFLSHQQLSEALLPYMRQLLPTLNMFVGREPNMGDRIDYAQNRGDNIAALIQTTLEIIDRCGGEEAYLSIKYMIPTYQSSTYHTN